MEIRNCRYCGRMFHYFGGDELCPRCKDVLEERFKLVKEFIYDNPEATAHEVAKEFDISVQTIYRWVREERLEFSKSSAFGLPCECCGETIKVGRFCKNCKATLGKRLSDVYKKEEKQPKNKKDPENPKMRFLQE